MLKIYNDVVFKLMRTFLFRIRLTEREDERDRDRQGRGWAVVVGRGDEGSSGRREEG